MTVAAAGSLALLGALPAGAADVTLSASIVGATPEIVGYNSGHFMPGSNTAAWWKYSGVNGARVWSTPAVVEGSDDNGVFGDGVGTQQQFVDRRALVRANPMGTPQANTYINWPLFENNYANNPTSGNIINLNYAFGQLHAMGVDPVVEIHRTNAAYPFSAAGTAAGWASRWEQWQHFYAQAFYLAKNFDVHRFQMYNEPNHSSNNIPQSEYLERLELASDAVQSAIADVNTLYGKSLDPQMQAPVAAGGSSVFFANPGGDPRDDTVGWGQSVMQNLHTNYLGQQDPNFKLIDTYAFQSYSGTASTFTSNVSALKSDVNAAAPGQGIRMAITEMNVSTAGNFELTTDTLDTPSRFSQMGSILSAVANAQTNELYVFKFSQTADTSASGVKKNGVSYVDNGNAPYNIGGVTKAAEVVRLFAKGFEGAQQLIQTPVATGTGASNYQLSASHNTAAGKYSVLASNLDTNPQTLNLNLANWNLPAGAMVTVEEVSADRQGEVRQWTTIPASKLLTLPQPAQSVFLVSVADHAPAYRVTLGATDDAMVKAGINANSNFGTSPNLFAKNDPTLADARNASFLKFDLGAIPTASVDQAILRLSGENVGTASQVIAHVYGIYSDGWDEQTITWNTAPNLASTTGTVNDISQNFITGVGTTADVVGELTGIATTRELMLDVTSFVRQHPDQKLSFLIAREVRWDGENVDDALTSLQLASKERGTDPGPQLMLSLTSAALPADFNGDGIVNGADLSAWIAGTGQSSGASKSSGDADGDGDVDGADYLVWQKSLGTSLSLAAPVASVPEPNAAAMLACVAGAVATFCRRARHAAIAKANRCR